MKKILATSLIAAAALSLGACSKQPETNTVAPAEATFNEGDIPAEGNLTAVDDYGNSATGLDNLAGANAADPALNATEPAGNGL